MGQLVRQEKVPPPLYFPANLAILHFTQNQLDVIPMAEQALNRRNTVFVEWRGQQRKLTELCREMGWDDQLIRGRLRMGWPVERAFTFDRISMAEKITELLRRGYSVTAVMEATGAKRNAVDVAKHRLSGRAKVRKFVKRSGSMPSV